MRFAVLGAGEIGSACALALSANGAKDVTLLSRDEEFIDRTRAAVGNATFKVFPRDPLIIPRQIELHNLASSLASQHSRVFVCAPCTALEETEVDARGGAAAAAPSAGASNSAAHNDGELPRFLQSWSMGRAQAAQEELHFAAVLTRGFSEDGKTPAELVDHIVNATISEKGHQRRRATPVLTVCGPLFAAEWAAQSSSSLSSSPSGRQGRGAGRAPPRPPSALGGAPAAGDCTGPPQRRCFSGTALAFALASPELRADSGLQTALAQLLQGVFPRESVTYLSSADSADVLGLVNGCLPLCAFGAGMVSNAYAGSTVSALSAYTLHAFSATEALVNGVLARPQGTPLPACALSAIALVCTNFSAREFVLGRRIDYHFRKQDVIQAVFPPGSSHRVFSTTADGVHTLLQRHGVASPFYEVLMDCFNTLVRASVAGEGLVKEGYYDYREGAPSLLLQHAMRVDEAMLSGNEEQFEEAKRQLAATFAPEHTAPAQSPVQLH